MQHSPPVGTGSPSPQYCHSPCARTTLITLVALAGIALAAVGLLSYLEVMSDFGAPAQWSMVAVGGLIELVLLALYCYKKSSSSKGVTSAQASRESRAAAVRLPPVSIFHPSGPLVITASRETPNPEYTRSPLPDEVEPLELRKEDIPLDLLGIPGTQVYPVVQEGCIVKYILEPCPFQYNSMRIRFEREPTDEDIANKGEYSLMKLIFRECGITGFDPCFRVDYDPTHLTDLNFQQALDQIIKHFFLQTNPGYALEDKGTKWTLTVGNVGHGISKPEQLTTYKLLELLTITLILIWKKTINALKPVRAQ